MFHIWTMGEARYFSLLFLKICDLVPAVVVVVKDTQNQNPSLCIFLSPQRLLVIVIQTKHKASPVHSLHQYFNNNAMQLAGSVT